MDSTSVGIVTSSDLLLLRMALNSLSMYEGEFVFAPEDGFSLL
jgi:hypothetical protein